MFRRLPSHTRHLTPAPLLSALVTAALLFGAVSASADTLLPGSDESIAVGRETALELTNPTGPDRLPELKSKAAAAISLRQSRLAELSRRSAKDGDCSRPVLADLLTADANALNSLGTQLAAETDVKRAKDTYRRIYSDLRVYGLESPRVALSSACAIVVARTVLLQGRIATLTAVPPLGADPAVVAATLVDLPARVQATADKARIAVQQVTILESDKGDKAVAMANIAALRDAQDSLKATEVELTAVDTLLDGLRKGPKALKKANRIAAGVSSSTSGPSNTAAP